MNHWPIDAINNFIKSVSGIRFRMDHLNSKNNILNDEIVKQPNHEFLDSSISLKKLSNPLFLSDYLVHSNKYNRSNKKKSKVNDLTALKDNLTLQKPYHNNNIRELNPAYISQINQDTLPSYNIKAQYSLNVQENFHTIHDSNKINKIAGIAKPHCKDFISIKKKNERMTDPLPFDYSKNSNVRDPNNYSLEINQKSIPLRNISKNNFNNNYNHPEVIYQTADNGTNHSDKRSKNCNSTGIDESLLFYKENINNHLVNESKKFNFRHIQYNQIPLSPPNLNYEDSYIKNHQQFVPFGNDWNHSVLPQRQFTNLYNDMYSHNQQLTPVIRSNCTNVNCSSPSIYLSSNIQMQNITQEHIVLSKNSSPFHPRFVELPLIHNKLNECNTMVKAGNIHNTEYNKGTCKKDSKIRIKKNKKIFTKSTTSNYSSYIMIEPARYDQCHVSYFQPKPSECTITTMEGSVRTENNFGVSASNSKNFQEIANDTCSLSFRDTNNRIRNTLPSNLKHVQPSPCQLTLASSSLCPIASIINNTLLKDYHHSIRLKTPLKIKYWRNGRRNIQCFPFCKAFGDYTNIKLQDLKQHDFMWGKCRGSLLVEAIIRSKLNDETHSQNLLGDPFYNNMELFILARIHSIDDINNENNSSIKRESFYGQLLSPSKMEEMKRSWIIGEKVPDFMNVKSTDFSIFEFKPKVWKYSGDIVTNGKSKRKNVRYYVQFECFMAQRKKFHTSHKNMNTEIYAYLCIASGYSSIFEIGSSRVLARQKRKIGEIPYVSSGVSTYFKNDHSFINMSYQENITNTNHLNYPTNQFSNVHNIYYPNNGTMMNRNHKFNPYPKYVHRGIDNYNINPYHP